MGIVPAGLNSRIAQAEASHGAMFHYPILKGSPARGWPRAAFAAGTIDFSKQVLCQYSGVRLVGVCRCIAPPCVSKLKKTKMFEFSIYHICLAASSPKEEQSPQWRLPARCAPIFLPVRSYCRARNRWLKRVGAPRSFCQTKKKRTPLIKGIRCAVGPKKATNFPQGVRNGPGDGRKQDTA